MKLTKQGVRDLSDFGSRPPQKRHANCGNLHQWTEWNTIQEDNWSGEEVQQRVCLACGEMQRRTISYASGLTK